MTDDPRCANKQFQVRSEDGETWAAFGNAIRERGAPLAAGANVVSGEKVLILNGEGPQATGVEAEILEVDGQSVRVAYLAQIEPEVTSIALGSGQVCSIGNTISKEELLNLCSKQPRKPQDASDPG